MIKVLKRFFQEEKNNKSFQHEEDRIKDKVCEGIPKKDDNKVKSIYFEMSETDMRDMCHHHIDTFEHWSRRLIDETFKENFEEDYFDYMVNTSQPLIKKEIKDRVEGRMRDNPGRYARKIDAIVMDDLIYFFTRKDLYKLFKQVFEPFFSGDNEIRSVLERLLLIRNKLSHGSHISLHEAEQCVCYTNDFIETYKLYYKKQGKEKKYNVPTFIRITDSMGNEIFRENSNIYWELFCHGPIPYMPNIQLRSGDVYKLKVEVDQSFNAIDYNISWVTNDGTYKYVSEGNGTEILFKATNKMVGKRPDIKIYLISNKEWHRFSNIDCDDYICLHLNEVLPPIEDTY